MAQLTGVVTIDTDHDAIYYKGAMYVKTEDDARPGDIIRSDRSYSFLPRDTFYEIEADGMFSDMDGDKFSHDPDEETLFRKVVSQDYLAAKRAQLEALTAEIAQLEAELTISPGDWVRVIKRSHNYEFSTGDIVCVTNTDMSDLPYHIVSADGKTFDWATADAVVKITPAEAKAELLAELTALFTG